MKLKRSNFSQNSFKTLVSALILVSIVGPFAPLVAYADISGASVVGDTASFVDSGNFTWTVPDGISSVRIKVWGAGGAAGNGEKVTDAHRSGLGGGAGGYSEKTLSVRAGEQFSVAIGAGGRGIKDIFDGRAGNEGGESRFEGPFGVVRAVGGHGGTSYAGHGNPTNDLGVGGIAEGGDINLSGSNAGPYIEYDGNPYASNGGASPNGGAGGGRGRCGRDGTCPGSELGSSWAADGGFPGGGGGGSDVGQGGYGANGQVTIEVVSLVPDISPITPPITPPPVVPPVTPPTLPVEPPITPPVTTIDNKPIGYLDNVSCSLFAGWAYDPDDASAQIGVHFYVGGEAGKGKFVGNTIANIPRADVNKNAGISGNHGFSFPIPSVLRDGATHTIYAYGINSNGSTNLNNSLLTQGPLSINGCTVSVIPPVIPTTTPPVTPPPVVPPVTSPADATVVKVVDDGGNGRSVVVSPLRDISLSLPNALSTSETGSKVSFTAVLTSVPAGNVIFPVKSSNFNEGTTSPVTSIIFTPSNWNILQTITVTGINDTADDGDVVYTVAVGPSVSADFNWNNIAAKSFSLVNTDDDPALTSGSSGGGSIVNAVSVVTTSGGSSGSGSGSGSRRRCTGFGCPAVSASADVISGDIWITLDNAKISGSSVFGSEKVCPAGNFITAFLRRGIDNNPDEVRKLQYFLNTYEKAGLAVNGDFDLVTEEAVKAMQAKYTEEILAPWGVTEPTGIVYVTTTRHINTVYCRDNPTYKNNGFIKDIPINPEDFENAIGQATSSVSNIAGVIGSLTDRVVNFLKDIHLYALAILLLLFLGAWFIIYGIIIKDIKSGERDMSFMRGSAMFCIGSVLDVLNTLSFMLNPSWFYEKTNLTLSWLLGLDVANLLLVITICLSALMVLYSRISKVQMK